MLGTSYGTGVCSESCCHKVPKALQTPNAPPQPSIGRTQSVYMHMEPDPSPGPDHPLPTTPKLYKCQEAPVPLCLFRACVVQSQRVRAGVDWS